MYAKNKILYVAIVLLIIIANYSIDDLKASSNTSFIDLYIEPETVNLDVGQTYTFTSYALFTTGESAVSSSWSLSDESLATKVNCPSSSKTCQIKTLKGPSTLIITSNYKTTNSKATAAVQISGKDYPVYDELVTEDEDMDEEINFIIEPEEISLSLSNKYTSSYNFVSYMDFPTGQVKVSSEWTSDSELIELGPNCATECTVYARSETGDAVLKAQYKNNKAETIIHLTGQLENPFIDNLPDWAEESIIQLYNRDIIGGYNNGKYGPSDSVSRAQFVLLIERLLKFMDLYDGNFLNAKDCDLFNDVSSDHYAYSAVCYFAYKGWLDIDSDTIKVFRPDKPLARDIAAYNIFKSVLEDRMDKDSSTGDIVSQEEVFDDVESPYQYYNEINSASYYGLMTGKSNGDLFYPHDYLNRAEAAVILLRIKDKIK